MLPGKLGESLHCAPWPSRFATCDHQKGDLSCIVKCMALSLMLLSTCFVAAMVNIAQRGHAERAHHLGVVKSRLLTEDAGEKRQSNIIQGDLTSYKFHTKRRGVRKRRGGWG